MNSRMFLSVLAVIAAISPSTSKASSENAALNACASAFASSIAAPGSAAPAYKLKYPGDHGESPLASYYGIRYTFYLQAQNARTGLPLARASCSVDASGTIALTSMPMDESGPALAAQF
jgi:hypothetical protein